MNKSKEIEKEIIIVKDVDVKVEKRDIEEYCYLIEKIPNTIILNIIEKIEKNVDLICLLLTCKKLYYSIRQLYSSNNSRTLKFKQIRYYDKDYNTNNDVVKSLKCFNLQSFKGIFDNSLSDQIVISDIQDTLPSLNNHLTTKQQQQQSITTNDNNNHINYSVLISLSYDSNKKKNKLNDIIIPTNTKDMFISYVKDEEEEEEDEENYYQEVVPIELFEGLQQLETLSLGYSSIGSDQIEKLPNTIKKLHLGELLLGTSSNGHQVTLPAGLEHLDFMITPPNGKELWGGLGLDKLKSLKTLTMPHFDGSFTTLPTTLTSLDINFESVKPPNQFFESLVHLSTLYIYIHVLDHVLDLTHNHALEKLDIHTGYSVLGMDSFFVKLPLSSSFKELYHRSSSYPLAGFSTQFLPTTLTRLETSVCDLDLSTIQLPRSLVQVTLENCRSIPVGFLPRDGGVLKKLSIHLDGFEGLSKGSIPSSVQDLKLFHYSGPTTPDYIPNSIKRLSWFGNIDTLPQGLECLKWKYPFDSFVYPSSSSSSSSSSSPPPVIRALPPINIPQSLTKLTLELDAILKVEDHLIYSISKLRQQDDTYNILPNSISKLKIKLPYHQLNTPFSFRLDEIINQTNVETLSIYGAGRVWFNATIKRLESDHSSVLLVSNKSLFGGIIKQTKLNQSGSNQYAPIYLHYNKLHESPSWSHNEKIINN
ncbi:hypothetical protein DFA_09573 [Cavenderia fasciculata]|uniref:Uncharacterized protein n=1 Tax=Cavenderia fasciculata TaxID=261658 RepID=F4Q804_CACFS|nr:uncharacterized protein DFA_09573 [Cavenderia fasciculata]EGG15904.1 hypothetical protein DFA_09573 [Cavenderia fasciculata]|eukprot:XP_004352229.1 hypothetical protein DFA_09573 [Cavenderia fasciculata]